MQALVYRGPFDTAVEEVMADPVGRRVQLGIRQPAFRARPRMVDVHQGLAVRHHVDDRLEQVGKVVLHRSS